MYACVYVWAFVYQLCVDRSSSVVGPFLCPSVCAIVWSADLSVSPLCCQCICMFVYVFFYMVANMSIIRLIVCVDVCLRQFSCRPLPVVGRCLRCRGALALTLTNREN